MLSYCYMNFITTTITAIVIVMFMCKICLWTFLFFLSMLLASYEKLTHFFVSCHLSLYSIDDSCFYFLTSSLILKPMWGVCVHLFLYYLQIIYLDNFVVVEYFHRSILDFFQWGKSQYCSWQSYLNWYFPFVIQVNWTWTHEQNLECCAFMSP